MMQNKLSLKQQTTGGGIDVSTSSGATDTTAQGSNQSRVSCVKLLAARTWVQAGCLIAFHRPSFLGDVVNFYTLNKGPGCSIVM